ncbi:MAG: GntR family transcriptional regulator [Aeromicrobium erythreum]
MPDLTIDPTSPEPPFEQLRRQVAAAVADGSLAPGHRLPTVRGLATDLGLAVNTVAKAYRTLEADGVLETRGRAGTFVRGTGVDRAAAQLVVAARRAGLSLRETSEVLARQWADEQPS